MCHQFVSTVYCATCAHNPLGSYILRWTPCSSSRWYGVTLPENGSINTLPENGIDYADEGLEAELSACEDWECDKLEEVGREGLDICNDCLMELPGPVGAGCSGEEKEVCGEMGDLQVEESTTVQWIVGGRKKKMEGGEGEVQKQKGEKEAKAAEVGK
ncbi:MAG: hypothetical protein M1831_004741 [Alyxoria varia]|nr:MAG: hypothetical protein M1831_004741 [Alyxoria varia]